MTMKILVTGGSGFIGTYLIQELNKLDPRPEIVIYDKNPSLRYPELVLQKDVRDRLALAEACKGVDVIVNLAAEHRDDVSPKSLYYDVNVRGAENIVAAAEAHNIKKVLFTSSVAIYGLKTPNPSEESPADPFNDYGRSKRQAEEVFLSWSSRSKDRTLLIIRPVVIFGPGNKGNVYNLIRQIADRKFMMIGSGGNKKSMGYVENLAIFIAAIIVREQRSMVLNYADKPDMTVRELVHQIRVASNISTRLVAFPYWIGLAGGYVFDLLSRITRRKFAISSIRIKKFCAETVVSTKMLESLNYQPAFSLREGLSRMIASIKSGN